MFITLMVLFSIFLLPYYLLTNLKVSKIFTPINYSILMTTIAAMPGSILILIYDQTYFNKIIDRARGYELEFQIVLLLAFSLFVLYVFSFWEQKPPIKPVPIIHINFIYTIVMILILYLSFIRLNLLISITSASATERFLVYRTAVSGIESGFFYFFKYLIIDCVGWVLALTICQNKNLRLTDKLYLYTIAFYFLTSFTKSKLLFFIISIWVVRNRYDKIKFGRLVKLGVILSVFLIIIWVLLLDFDKVSYLYDPASEGLVARIFISEISALYAHLQLFDGDKLIGFSSLSNSLSSVFGLEHSLRSGEIVMRSLNPSWLERGISGTFNTHFTGEAFANFGLAGLLITPILVPVIILLYTSLVNFISVKYRYPVFIFLTLNLSVMSGFNNFLYNPFLLILIFLLVLFANIKRYVLPTR